MKILNFLEEYFLINEPKKAFSFSKENLGDIFSDKLCLKADFGFEFFSLTESQIVKSQAKGLHLQLFFQNPPIAESRFSHSFFRIFWDSKILEGRNEDFLFELRSFCKDLADTLPPQNHGFQGIEKFQKEDIFKSNLELLILAENAHFLQSVDLDLEFYPKVMWQGGAWILDCIIDDWDWVLEESYCEQKELLLQGEVCVIWHSNDRLLMVSKKLIPLLGHFNFLCAKLIRAYFLE